MLKKFSVLALATLALAGCDTFMDDEETKPAGVTGGVNSSTGYSTGGVNSSNLTPGSYDAFVAEAGDRVFFGYDSSVIDAEAQATLARQAEWLKSYADKTITVEGHCDERGTREYNLALGERRATAVKNYLASLGVEKSRISTISYGKEHPEVVGSSDDAWSKNRRGVTVVN